MSDCHLTDLFVSFIHSVDEVIVVQKMLHGALNMLDGLHLDVQTLLGPPLFTIFRRKDFVKLSYDLLALSLHTSTVSSQFIPKLQPRVFLSLVRNIETTQAYQFPHSVLIKGLLL